MNVFSEGTEGTQKFSILFHHLLDIFQTLLKIMIWPQIFVKEQSDKKYYDENIKVVRILLWNISIFNYNRFNGRPAMPNLNVKDMFRLTATNPPVV